MYICKKKNKMKNKVGRKRTVIDNRALQNLTLEYKKLFCIDENKNVKELSKFDKVILSYHFLSLENMNLEAIAVFLGFKTHASIIYNRRKVSDFLADKHVFNSDEFEEKFFTFNAHYNLNKKTILQ